VALNTRPGHVDPRQAAADAHADVIALADLVLRHRDLALLKIARKAILQTVPSDDITLKRMLGSAFTPGLLEAASAVAKAGSRLCNEPDEDRRKRCRGAVLERIVHGLVAQRATAEREADIELIQHEHTGREWSRPKDVVVPVGDPVEVYECKFNGVWLDQDDVEELGDIDQTARHAGGDCRATVAVMSSAESLFGARANLRLQEPLYFAELEDLLDLSRREASRQLT
jgi:hypothetical protein